jgi:hypothetical protein
MELLNALQVLLYGYFNYKQKMFSVLKFKFVRNIVNVFNDPDVSLLIAKVLFLNDSDVSLLNAKIGQLKTDSLGVMVRREAEAQPFSYETAVEGSR